MGQAVSLSLWRVTICDKVEVGHSLIQLKDAPHIRRAMREGYPTGPGSAEAELFPMLPDWLWSVRPRESNTEEANKMGRHFVSYEALCPFYKAEDKNMIYCEGVAENSSIHNAFSGSAARYKREYCCKNWESCLIAGMLGSKYE